MSGPSTTYRCLLGAVIARRRGNAGLRQTDVAEKLACSQTFVCHVEGGDIAVNLDNLVLLAEALGVSPGRLLMETDVARGGCIRRGIEVNAGREDRPPDQIVPSQPELRRIVNMLLDSQTT